MDVEKIAAHLENEDGLSRTLGMQFMSTPEPDTLMGKMTVDDRNKQPFGFLSGGATLALAENVAGVGSMGLCPGKIDVYKRQTQSSSTPISAHSLTLLCGIFASGFICGKSSTS